MKKELKNLKKKKKYKYKKNKKKKKKKKEKKKKKKKKKIYMPTVKKELSKIIGKENIDYYIVSRDKKSVEKPSLMSYYNLLLERDNGKFELSILNKISNEKMEKVKKYIKDTRNIDADNVIFEVKSISERDKENKFYKTFKTKEEADKFYKEKISKGKKKVDKK